MTHAIARRTLTLAACAIMIGAAPATRPPTATRPTASSRPTSASRPAAKARVADPLKDAIVALIKEGVDAARANKPFPRESSSYFGIDVTIPQPDLIAALAKTQHPNPRVDAYVKLQLLSAVGTFDAANAVPAISAYVLGAPAIIPMPAMDIHARSDWDGRQSAANDANEVDRVNDDFAKQAAPVEHQNEIILEYRDAMRKRIATSDADRVRLFAAELEDVSQRAAAGLDEANKSFGKLAAEIKKWSAGAARKQVDAMMKVVDEYASRRPTATIYSKLTWNEKTRHARWTTRPASIEATKLAALKVDLLAAERAATN